jgi:hypothetical protein
MPGIERRRFLLVVATAAAAGLAGGARAWAATVRTSGQARAATYRALVRALRTAPDGRFRHADPGVAYGRYARWHAAQPAATRMHADAVLDALAAGGLPGYAQLAAQPRGTRGAERRATVAAAVALACIGCEPRPGIDERPDVPTLAPA